MVQILVPLVNSKNSWKFSMYIDVHRAKYATLQVLIENIPSDITKVPPNIPKKTNSKRGS
jgi:hypothetical protein